MQAQTPKQLAAMRKEQRAAFIALVQRQEVLAKKSPAAYKGRVKALAWLGYGYIVFVLVIAIALIAGICWLAYTSRSGTGIVRLLIILVIFCFAILRSLWVRIPAPAGIEITRQDAPKLFDEIDRISSKLDAIKIHRVLVDDEFNAAAIQIPRFGIFGLPKNYLVLGVPLLLSLSPDEFRAIVAHEFGHFSGQHGKFGCWVYRLNQTWVSLQANLRNHRIGGIVFGTFFNWFEPLFAATTFVLRRENEYEADRISAQVAGAENSGVALMRCQYASPHIQERFWAPMGERIKSEPTPPSNMMAELANCARGAVEPEFVQVRLEQALKSKTDDDDTHPCLRDRLEALGFSVENLEARYSVALTQPLPDTAANFFVGSGMESIMGRVNQTLISTITEGWAESHAAYQGQKQLFDKLEAEMAARPLTMPESLEYASLTSVLRSPQEAIPLFNAYLEKAPEDPDALLLYGDCLLDLNDKSGIDILRRAMTLKPTLSMAAINRIGEFEHARGNDAELETLRDEMLEASSADELSSLEAQTFNLTDKYVPHELSPDKVEALAEQFRTRTDVVKVFVVRKFLPSMPTAPRLTLIIERKIGFLDTEDANGTFANKIVQEINSPERFMLYVPKKPKPWIEKLSKIPGALIVDLSQKK